MIGAGYSEWLARGQTQQSAGRLVDALLCYRAALEANRHSVQAQFHLGEVLERLGRSSEGFEAWRAALTLQPRHVAALMAFGAAARRVGNPQEAAEAFRRALAIEPQNAAAARGLGLARLALGDATVYADFGALFLGAAGDKTIDAAMHDVARLLAGAPASTERTGLLAEIETIQDAELPPLLLALLAEQALSEGADARALSWLGRAAGATSAIDDPEALRRLAIVAGQQADAETDRAASSLPRSWATAWATQYAQRCAALHAPKIPLLWPRRLAGASLRIAYLIDLDRPLKIGAVIVDAARFVADVAATHSPDRIVASVYTVGRREGARPVATGDSSGFTTTHLGPSPDRAVAQMLADADLDAIVDLAGMAATSAALLAQRPARTVWTPATLFAAHVAPLVTHQLPAPASGESDGLAAYRRTIEAAMLGALIDEPWFVDSAALSPSEMAQAWRRAVSAHQAGDIDAASDAYRAVLDTQPSSAGAHYLLGIIHRDRGETYAAVRELAASISAAPSYIDARVALADVLRTADAPGAAISYCREGLALTPDEPALWRALGLAELAKDQGANARDAFERALALAPADAETHYNHGVALQTLKRNAGALRAYQRALVLDPVMTAAEYNIGVIFRDQGRVDAAIAAFAQVLARSPKHVQAHHALCETLLEASRFEEWLQAFRRFEAHCPNALSLAVQALQARQYMGDLSGVDHYLERLRRDEFVPASETELADCLESLLHLELYFDVDPRDMLGLYRAYRAVAPRVYGAPLAASPSRRPGRIRIGYVSGDLRNHVMGKMMWQAVSRHDRERFELFFYSLSQSNDDWTERFRVLGDHFESLAGKSEREAAARIALDDIDLLVDLSTHTRGAMPGILALKPARVQLTHVASAGSVGLSTIDFKLTDAFADLPENEAHQDEELLIMRGCAYPYRHVAPPNAHRYHRQSLGIAADAVVVGAFVNPIKLSRRCLSLWREVLERVPQAVLAISPLSPQLVDVYRRLFASVAISAERMIVLPAGTDDGDNQARYHVVDFTLDTMPYGGVNGTLESLDMGVPVVTLCGKRHGERTSYSILANLGVTDTVAQSGSEYVAIAVRLATDAAFMAKVREAIHAGLRQSALTDMETHTRNLEAAYVDALRLRTPLLPTGHADG